MSCSFVAYRQALPQSQVDYMDVDYSNAIDNTDVGVLSGVYFLNLRFIGRPTFVPVPWVLYFIVSCPGH